MNSQILTEWTTLKSLITKQQQELQALKIQLAQERNWWDKWIADENLSYRGTKSKADTSLPHFVYQQIGLKGESKLLIGFDYYPFLSEKVDFAYKSLSTYQETPQFNEMTKEKLQLFKKIIQAIANYYKSQI
ncbi:MAG: hypothetical protein GBAus27B_000301 [Mycoplasmataceae bacterium]|nr:MAG: hypothetical protein GBAus27B_000301 [Mycoplasmataceae bacterium]